MNKYIYNNKKKLGKLDSYYAVSSIEDMVIELERLFLMSSASEFWAALALALTLAVIDRGCSFSAYSRSVWVGSKNEQNVHNLARVSRSRVSTNRWWWGDEEDEHELSTIEFMESEVERRLLVAQIGLDVSFSMHSRKSLK